MIKNTIRCMGAHLVAYHGPWLTCFVGLLILPFFTGHIPIVRFTEEEILVTVYPRSIAVDAFYHYRNPFPFPVSHGYIIAFPEDDDHFPPFKIELVQCIPEEKWISIWHFLGKHRFFVNFPSNGDVTLHLYYEQSTPQGRGTYILTTTQPWGRPLEKCLYRLMPEGVGITGSNYPLNPDRSGAFN